MEQCFNSPNSGFNGDGSIEKKLDKLAEDIKSLPEERAEECEGLMEEKAFAEEMKKSTVQLAFSVEDGANYLSVSVSTLRRAIKNGRVKTFRVGRLLRISLEELRNCIEVEGCLSLEDAADILGVSAITIRRLVKAGTIKAFRFSDNGPFRINQSEIDRMMRGE